MIIGLLVLGFQGHSQCCAAGNPFSGDGAFGSGRKGMIELGVMHRHSYSDRYYQGSEPSDYTYIDYSSFDFSSFSASFSPDFHWVLSAEIGYFFSKKQVFDFGDSLQFERNAKGLGDLSLGFRYRLPVPGGFPFEVFPSFRLSLPVGKFDQTDGPVVMPIDIQPSSGSFRYQPGLMLVRSIPARGLAFALAGTADFSQRINMRGTRYKYGDVYYCSLSGSARWAHRWQAYVQLRGVWTMKSRNRDDEVVQSTGGRNFLLLPQLGYEFSPGWTLGTGFDWPFLKKVNGRQLTNAYMVWFRLSFSFAVLNP